MRSSARFGFPRELRLHRKAQITAVLARGRSTNIDGIRLHSVPGDGGPRLGVIAGRHAWPRAVDRNRFRRLARETFRLLQHDLQARDYIVRVRDRQPGVPSSIELQKLLAAWCKPEAV